MSDSDLDARRLALEEKKLEHEIACQEEANKIRRDELSLKREEVLRSRWTNPLVLAIVAAAIAAGGNAFVSFLNAGNQAGIEINRYLNLIDIERERSEAGRILEAVKAGSPQDIAAKLRFLIEVGLVSDLNRRAALEAYLKLGPQQTPPSLSTPPVIEQYKTGWLGGGNNQSTQCAIGRTVVAAKHPGKTILLRDSGEESKKDWLGRVEYRYFCNFEVR